MATQLSSRVAKHRLARCTLSLSDPRLYTYYLGLMRPISHAIKKGGTHGTELVEHCAEHSELRILPRQTLLFKPSSRGRKVHYMVDGRITLLNDKHQPIADITIDPTSLHRHPTPLGGDSFPKQQYAITKSRSTVIQLDLDNLNLQTGLRTIMDAHSEEKYNIHNQDWISSMLGHGWFMTLSPKELDKLINLGEPTTVQAGQVLQQINTEINDIYIITDGIALIHSSASISILTAAAMLIANMLDQLGEIVRIAGPGSCIGDTCVVGVNHGDQRISPYTAEMLSQGTARRIPRRTFANAFGDIVTRWMVNQLSHSSLENAAQRATQNQPTILLGNVHAFPVKPK